MTVTVNGAGRDIRDGATVADAVTAVTGQGSGVTGRASGATGQARGVAVAVNGEVVPRADWARTRLHAGDRVEVLTATQGG